jgi:hypothetical protein
MTPSGRRLLFLACVGLEAARSPLWAQDASKVQIRFLSAKEAAEAIVDESQERYFSMLQPLEMIAKTGQPLGAGDLAAQRDECRRRYRDAARDFTEEETAAVTGACEAIHKGLREAYPRFAATPWSFLKLESSIEGGMPHTRGPHIVLPERMARQFAAFRARSIDPAKTRLAQTLIHEQCHVLQRAHAADFAEFYTGVWGLIRAKDLPGDPWLEKQQVVNPDGPDVGWVFPAKEGGTTQYWQPLVALKEGVERPSMPRDFVLIGVALDRKGDAFAPREGKDAKPELRPLDKIPAWMAAFGHVDENFHPNETFAVLFSWMAMKEHVAERGPGLEKHDAVDFTKLKEWCGKAFAQADDRK